MKPEQQELKDALHEIESQIVVALDNLANLGSRVDQDWSEQLKYQLLPAVDLTRAIRRLADGCSVQELRAGFGSPGDYGTNTRLGKALTSIYALPKDDANAPAIEAATELPGFKRLMRSLDNQLLESRDAFDLLRDKAYEAVESKLAADGDGDDADESKPDKIGKASGRVRASICLVGVLRKLCKGRSLQELYAAFGAPGDWGYETELGNALARFYRGES